MYRENNNSGIKCPILFSALKIKEDKSNSIIQFDFSVINLFDELQQPSMPYFRHDVDKKKIDKLIETFNRFLDDIDYNKLEKLGRLISNLLIPPEIREYLSFLEDQGYSIQLLLFTNDTQIPWEIIFDGRGFWAFRYSIGRIYGMPNNSSIRLPSIGKHIKKSKPPLLLIYDPEGNLEYAKKEGKLLENNLRESFTVTAHTGNVSEFDMALLLSSDSYDIIHFAGHSMKNSFLCAGGKLTSGEISRYTLVQRPLVFANACATAAKMEYHGTESMNLAEAFIQAGAAAYIGTLWKTDDKLSSNFATVLYDYLKDGYTIGYALTQTKKTLSAKKNHIDWAAYTLYGNPESRLFTKTSKEKFYLQRVKITMSNKPGTLAKILAEMSRTDVNIVRGRSITFENEKTAGYIAQLEIPKDLSEKDFSVKLLRVLPDELDSVSFMQ